MSTPVFLRHATVPGTAGPVSVLLADGVLRYTDGPPPGAREIDATGMLLLPGLYDLHAHLREPGREDCETLATGTEAAIAGGFTGLLMMPDTLPPVDNGGMVQSLLDSAAKSSRIPVNVAGSISRGRAGTELAEIGDMRSRGAVMITDDPDPVSNPQLLRRALQYARDLGILVASHCDVRDLSHNGSIHDGLVSWRLGLPGIHPCAEEIGIARDIRLAQSCRSPIHIKHVTTAQGVETIRRYRGEGVRVTAEVTPHHLLFSDEDVGDYDTNYKVKPPLRPAADREALLQGLIDGTIDAIATDHSPCTESEKMRDFASAPFGIIGLETALPSLYSRLIAPGLLTWETLIARMSAAPRRLLGLDAPTLTDGAPVNCVLFDPAATSLISRQTLRSGAHNTPWLGQEIPGRIILTALGPDILYLAP